MKLKSNLLAVLAIATMFGSAFAQETAEQEKTECEGQCPIACAMDALPKMTFKVGEESACCADAAAQLAEESGDAIEFVVGESTFETKEDAYVSLVEQTENFVTEFLTPCRCETSGVTKIAGEACNCPITAGKKAELVSSAADQVVMTYAVGEETCECPNEADAMAESSDEKKEFVVGEARTCCEYEARLNLARAKYKAAVEALAAASEEAEEATDTDS